MTEYEKINLLGEGGYAEVWECTSTYGEKVAMKVLKKIHETPDKISRFVREAKILEQLDHPCIVKIVDAKLDSSPYFYCMPRYASCLNKEFPEIAGDEKRVVPIFSSILEAIKYAHSKSIIHRDLKPDNILIDANDAIAVSDFGLGRILDSTSIRLTNSGQGFGTYGYACPEQWQELKAKEADERCDIYTIGILLYELYAGLLRGSFPQLEKLPAKIRIIVERCLQGNPTRRYKDLATLERSWCAATRKDTRVEALVQLKSLSKKFQQTADFDTEDLHLLTQLLAQVSEDSDLFWQELSGLGSAVLVDMYALYPESTTGFIKNLKHSFGRKRLNQRDIEYIIQFFRDAYENNSLPVSFKVELVIAMMFASKGKGGHRSIAIIKKCLIQNSSPLELDELS